jgi:hypothetical protein
MKFYLPFLKFGQVLYFTFGLSTIIFISIQFLLQETNNNGPIWNDMNLKDSIDSNKKPVIGILSQNLKDYKKINPRFTKVKLDAITNHFKYILRERKSLKINFLKSIMRNKK